jgi:hypothetical protein
MEQELEIKTLNIDDIKFLKQKLNFGFSVLFFFSLFSIIFPGLCIYLIFINDDITEKAFPFFGVIICFGFWTYVTLKGIRKTIKEKQNLYLQKKIQGNVMVLGKEIVRIKGDEANDTFLYEIKIYSEIEKKDKKISILEKYYDKIQIGNFLWIEYYLDCNYIKTINFDGQNIKYKIFSN